jgi:cell division protease FtsH
VDAAYRDAEKILNENWDKVEAVAEALLRYETLSADEVHKIMRGERLDKPTVGELLALEAKRKPAGNDAPATEPKPDLPPGTLPSPA